MVAETFKEMWQLLWKLIYDILAIFDIKLDNGIEA